LLSRIGAFRRSVFLWAWVCLLLAAYEFADGQEQQPSSPPTSTQQQHLPDAPGATQSSPQKDENPNPVQQLQDKTKEVVLKARDWESGWIAGIYVGKYRKLVPLTGKQREDYYLHQTLTTPEAYMKRAFSALVDQARGVPAWQGGIGGYAERFASREGQFVTANSIAALGNAKLGYEVRYDKCKCSDFRHRLQHAIMRNFLTYDRSEANLRPQFALYGGAFGGGVMATAWKPSPKNAWVNGGWAVLGQAAYGSLLNIVTEFGTEINRKQGVVR
jgi:hypothetical protein